MMTTAVEGTGAITSGTPAAAAGTPAPSAPLGEASTAASAVTTRPEEAGMMTTRSAGAASASGAAADSPVAFTGHVGAAAFQQALAETSAAKLAPADAGVPRELVPRVLEGPERHVYAVWQHWRQKRQVDPEGVHMP